MSPPTNKQCAVNPEAKHSTSPHKYDLTNSHKPPTTQILDTFTVSEARQWGVSRATD